MKLSPSHRSLMSRSISIGDGERRADQRRTNMFKEQDHEPALTQSETRERERARGVDSSCVHCFFVFVVFTQLQQK